MRNGREEPVGVIIHICMDTTQRNSLSLSQTSKNIMFLFFLYFMSFLLQNWRTGRQIRLGVGAAVEGRGTRW
jgi:hypothetical protein